MPYGRWIQNRGLCKPQLAEPLFRRQGEVLKNMLAASLTELLKIILKELFLKSGLKGERQGLHILL